MDEKKIKREISKKKKNENTEKHCKSLRHKAYSIQ